MLVARETQLFRDIFWNLVVRHGDGFKHITWQGYDDENWWHNVAESDQFQVQSGYRLNPRTCEVEDLYDERTD